MKRARGYALVIFTGHGYGRGETIKRTIYRRRKEAQAALDQWRKYDDHADHGALIHPIY